MAEMTEIDAYIATPVSNGPAYVPSTTYSCSECGQDVHVSTATGVPIVETGIPIVCVPCMISGLEDHPDAELVVRPEIAAEALAALEKMEASGG